MTDSEHALAIYSIIAIILALRLLIGRLIYKEWFK